MIVVTGCNGMIGTALCERFNKMGVDYVGVDVRRLKDSKAKGVYYCDLTKRFPTIYGADMVIHLAANARVYPIVKNPKQAFENYKMTFNVLEFCKQNKVPLVFASSREVYEANKNPYAASKFGQECLVQSYSRCYDIDFNILRFSNVYGKYDYSDRVIPTFFRRAKKKLPLYVYGKEKALDFTYIDDAVDAILAAMEKFHCCSIDIGSGVATRLVKVAKMFSKNVVVKENRVGEIMYYKTDLTAAKGLLKYKPKVMIEEGVRRAKKWMKKNL